MAFATIYRTNEAAIIGFRSSATESLGTLQVGIMRIRHIDWLADGDVSADTAGLELAQKVERWLETIDQTSEFIEAV